MSFSLPTQKVLRFCILLSLAVRFKSVSKKEEVLAYIQKELSHLIVTEKSEFVNDLSIDGDDVDDFFRKLFKHHPLNLDGQDWSNYFHSEGELIDFVRLIRNAANKIGICKKQNLRELQPFTVGEFLDLYETKNTKDA